MARTARSVLLLCVLCVAGGAAAAMAIAVPGHPSSRRSSHAARACHRTKHHRHCLAARAEKKSNHRRGSGAKPSEPKSTSKGSGSPASSAPWTAAPTPVIPGSTPGSGGTSPGAAGGAPPAEAPVAPAGPAHVQVTAEDIAGYHFILSRTTVPAGQVIVEFVNHGQDEHNLHAVEPAAGSEAGSLPNTEPKAHPTLALNLHAGSYTLFCSLPHHEEKGMKATLLVH
jgi:plastocyanin